jgi:3-phosphoshikimate 1-carboxyvinyltransferase
MVTKNLHCTTPLERRTPMITLSSSRSLRGELTIPGDKSISHRAIMLASLAEGTTRIRHFLKGADCLATIRCFEALGIDIDVTADCILVHGKGLSGLQAPTQILDVQNSGTTTRLLAGILAGQPFCSTLSGDASLNQRPMKRILDPLTLMGANIKSQKGNGCAPLTLAPSHLRGITYHSPVASAQVKSCILLAGLYANGETRVSEPSLSRDHTERMLRAYGANLTTSCEKKDTHTNAMPSPYQTILRPGNSLYAQDLIVPGDISSAAYWIAAGLLVPHSELYLRNVGINPTRAGILAVCKQMGANITLENERLSNGEPVADLLVRSSTLHGTTIGGDLIPTLIDEIPILAVMATAATGRTIIKDAAELKVKETNRIDTVTENLKRMGATIIPTDDGMIIEGNSTLSGATISPHYDHRIAMAFSIAALIARGDTTIEEHHCVDVSYPGFFEELKKLTM